MAKKAILKVSLIGNANDKARPEGQYVDFV